MIITRHTMWVDGVDSRDFGIYCLSCPDPAAANPQYSQTAVPGLPVTLQPRGYTWQPKTLKTALAYDGADREQAMAKLLDAKTLRWDNDPDHVHDVLAVDEATLTRWVRSKAAFDWSPTIQPLRRPLSELAYMAGLSAGDYTLAADVPLVLSAMASGKGTINVYQVMSDGEHTKLYSAAVDSTTAVPVQTGEAVDASAPADISGNVRVEVTGDVVLSGAVVTAANPGWAIPFPLITIPAAGTVSVGDYTVTAEAPVTIDMLKRLVYDADGKSAWHKIDNRRFPDFPAGQDLTVSGNCSVNPQWRWR